MVSTSFCSTLFINFILQTGKPPKNLRSVLKIDIFHPALLVVLATQISKLLASISENSCKIGKVPQDWKKASIIPTFLKENSGNYRTVGLTSTPGKVNYQCKYLEDNDMIKTAEMGCKEQTMLVEIIEK